MKINQDKCIGCGQCLDVCDFNAIKSNGDYTMETIEENCVDCGCCLNVCPNDAIEEN